MEFVDTGKMADDLDRSVEQSRVQLNLYFSNLHSIQRPSTLGSSQYSGNILLHNFIGYP
jgi:hypothetical protein